MEGGKNNDTILVVDDEQDIRTVLAAILERAKYVVLQAENGQKALEMLEELKGGISLVISDGEMPKMGGPELLTIVAARWPAVPRLLLSGRATMLARCPLGTSYLAKPVSFAALHKMVSDLVSGRTTAARPLD